MPLTTFDGKTLMLNAPSDAAVSAVFFSFTSCPEVCPTTMGNLKRVKKRLSADGAKLRVILVSLDPERGDISSMYGGF